MIAVRLLGSRVSATKSFQPGDVIDVPDEEAERMVASEQAVYVVPPAPAMPEPVPEPEPEAEAVEVPEEPIAEQPAKWVPPVRVPQAE